ncbi:MAG TPA: TorF family putative porin [Steroidobacteraceae bacterium]
MRKTRLVGILCLLASGALIAPAAGAAERLGGSVAITTDYIYRGLSQTEGQPALQGGLRLTSGQGLSAGSLGFERRDQP